MTNLMSMAKGRFKKSKTKSSSKNLARKTKKKSKSRKSSSSSNGAFSGKILGFKIPIVSDVLRNKTAQKVIAGAGIVSIALSIARLVNNPTINRAVGNRFVRLGLAGAAGDVTGVATEFVTQGGVTQLKGIVNGGGAQQTALVSAAGNGVA